jgi:hypothetical protein
MTIITLTVHLEMEVLVHHPRTTDVVVPVPVPALVPAIEVGVGHPKELHMALPPGNARWISNSLAARQEMMLRIFCHALKGSLVTAIITIVQIAKMIVIIEFLGQIYCFTRSICLAMGLTPLLRRSSIALPVGHLQGRRYATQAKGPQPSSDSGRKSTS